MWKNNGNKKGPGYSPRSFLTRDYLSRKVYLRLVLYYDRGIGKRFPYRDHQCIVDAVDPFREFHELQSKIIERVSYAWIKLKFNGVRSFVVASSARSSSDSYAFGRE